MGSKKKMFMVCGEEIGVEAFEKIGKDAIENYKIEMAQKVVKKEYECSVCKTSPRPSTKNVRKCTYCTKIFCDSCSSHQCPKFVSSPFDFYIFDFNPLWFRNFYPLNLEISTYYDSLLGF